MLRLHDIETTGTQTHRKALKVPSGRLSLGQWLVRASTWCHSSYGRLSVGVPESRSARLLCAMTVWHARVSFDVLCSPNFDVRIREDSSTMTIPHLRSAASNSDSNVLERPQFALTDGCKIRGPSKQAAGRR